MATIRESIHYWNQLTKPRVTILILATVMPGIYLGGDPSGFLIFITLLGTYLMASASFIFNQYVEKDRDAQMKRTASRPLPSGKVSPKTALWLGIVVTVVSFALLTYYVNLLTAICNLSALILYVFLYTIWLKPRTTQNIVIGGISGCVGPLIGYAAVSNSLPIPAWVLFAIIFFWTPAHFWALAIFLKDDYAEAHIPMMPVIEGVEKTTRSIFLYGLLYSICCLAFYFVEPTMSLLYLIGAGILTVWLLYYSYRLIRNHTAKMAKGFFFFSIAHLFAISILIVLDHSLHSV